MPQTQPFGDIHRATVMVIGHDPRLQRSDAQAGVAFFLDYLARPLPRLSSERRKYDLAHSLWDYVSDLAGAAVPLAELYVTNLCNEFLPRSVERGTVLIPDDAAVRGVALIAQAVSAGRFRVILPMGQQTFYHLCRLHFVDDNAELVAGFVAGARPRGDKAVRGICEPVGRYAFVAVCGRMFHHRGVPVVPILHVKNWPLKPALVRYAEPMQTARRNIRAATTATP